MNTKNILITVFALLVVVLGFWYINSKEENNINIIEEEGAVTFSGELEEVNTGCFADGECYVVVDGKHVTIIMGWSQEISGKIIGVEGFGDLESHIGREVEVYAKNQGDGTYTLYGSENFYISLE